MKTIEETIKGLKASLMNIKPDENLVQLAEWLEELKALREKNTPKKPSTFRKIRKYDGYDAGDCPSCGTPNDSVYHNVTCCWACGQRLDWRAEE